MSLKNSIIVNVHNSLFKVPVISLVFQSHLNILDRYSKKPQISNFMKIRPVGAKIFHAGKQILGN